MFTAEPVTTQLRRDPLPLLGRVAVVTGVSRRAHDHAGVARCSAIELPPSTTRYCPVM